MNIYGNKKPPSRIPGEGFLSGSCIARRTRVYLGCASNMAIDYQFPAMFASSKLSSSVKHDGF